MMQKGKGESQRRTFPVSGMGCAACAAKIGKVLGLINGVISVNVDLANSSVTVEYDSTECTPSVMKEALEAYGYGLVIDETEKTAENNRAGAEERYSSLVKRTIWAAVLSLPVFIIGMFFHNMPYGGYMMWILATPVVFVAGSEFHLSAWKQLKHLSFTMDTLVSSSTIISYLFSLFNLLFPDFWISRGIEPHLYFESSAVIITFILLGRTLEQKAKEKAGEAVRNLMDLAPQMATVLKSNGERVRVPVSEIKPGVLIEARPGDRIAVDGTVTEGSSGLDESMMTGESMPVEKTAGDPVYAGTVNRNGRLVYKAEKVGEDTVLSSIIRMVKEAQSSRAAVQTTVDRIASVFVPVIMALSVLTFAVWFFADPEEGTVRGLLSAVTVLVIACPCALGLATPAALTVGMGRGATEGILIRNADAIEKASRISAIVFDKTGTLTYGHPEVTEVTWVEEGRRCGEIFSALEQASGHPLAEAVVAYFGSAGNTEISGFSEIPGSGVTGIHKDIRYYAGNLAYMESLSLHPDAMLSGKGMEYASRAQGTVWFADQSGILAVAAVSDRIREDAAKTVKAFAAKGISTYLVTGDSERVAAHVAEQTGVDGYLAGAMPRTKVEFIRKLQSEGMRVAMVGDGINDSAALSVADIGIAMGCGSDIAKESAAITVISSDLGRVYTAVSLSEATLRILRENLFWAFIYNVIAIPVAAGALYPFSGFLLNPMIAGAAMAMSSVSVLANSLRLKHIRLR